MYNKYIKPFAVYIIFGISCGIIGALFAKGISLVTNIRLNNSWLLYLLPIAGIISVVINRLLKTSDMGTNQVIASANGNTNLSSKLAPAIFLSAILSHLCGASVGREGAALQLGGSSALFFSEKFKLSDENKKILIYCGMAGVFSSVFGTPLAATAFALEIVCVGAIYLPAVIPTLFTSLVSYFTAVLLGARPEHYTLSTLPETDFYIILKLLILSLMTVVLSYILCYSLKYSRELFKKLLKNDFLRIFVGGIAVIILTATIGSYDYNGAGIHIIEKIFNDNEFVSFAFVLKLIFTCISVGTGFKGGEIVPTLFIGATFGALMGSLLGLPIAFAAAICMISLFCGVTNCPFASVLLAAELFAFKGIGYILIAVIITFCLSGKISLYSSQKYIIFSSVKGAVFKRKIK